MTYCKEAICKENILLTRKHKFSSSQYKIKIRKTQINRDDLHCFLVLITFAKELILENLRLDIFFSFLLLDENFEKCQEQEQAKC